MITLFFILAFAITWGLQLPALLESRHFITGPPALYMGLVALGTFGPMLAAMVAARVEGTEIRALLRPLNTWRVGFRWYLVALAAPGGVFMIAAATYNLLGHHERLLYPPPRPAFALAAIAFAFGEETGWRGFALPRLRDRCGSLAASVIIGVLWALWLMPLLALQRVSPMIYIALVPLMVGNSVIFTWVVQHTNGSLLLAILTYVGAHLNNPGHELPAHSTPMVIQMVGDGLFAIAIVAFDFRRMWGGASNRRFSGSSTGGL